VEPNSKIFSIVFAACANLAALVQGREAHGGIIRSGFLSDVFAGSALADMYRKCGSLEVAHQVFDKMPLRDVVA
jgi:pentatricopeptide repeat protein